MSSTTTTAAVKPPVLRTITPTTAPISLQPTTIAHIYSPIHTLLVLGLYFLRFNGLVSDPISTIVQNSIGLAVLQGLYCAICVPLPVGEKKEKKGRAHAHKKKDEGNGFIGEVMKEIVPNFLSHFLSVLLTPFLLALLTLFGAPLTPSSAFQSTYLLSLHLSILSLPPLLYSHVLSTSTVREIFAAMLPFDEIWGGCVGVVVGAWFGAVPIPLDWDRDWQRWPVTIVVGSLIGWGVGRALGGTVGWGKRIWFGGEEEELEKKMQ
ncbi:MAG: Glycosylphosphatidylinositol (GPI) anchor assembly protein [Cirrosporium novae-zelandiae]|nr:MAG: Glycosylphosphatidylinositol (GPI) anchor assembly protein [Cirrosporium novae-zelandiae]